MSWSRVSLCLVLLTSCLAYGQTPVLASAAQSTNPPGVKESLEALSYLVGRLPDGSVRVDFAAFRLRSTLEKLQRLAENWPAESPADYRTNLDRSVRTLEDAVAANAPERLAALLEALADDLDVKLEHCINSGGKLGGSVAVTVRTVQGGRESRNWQVFYLPKVFEVLGGATPDRFPQLSSPTEETLVPGRYVMWARGPDGNLTSDRTVVKVGEGKQELQLDLLVPSDTSR